MWSESSDRIVWIIGHLLVLRSISCAPGLCLPSHMYWSLDKKTKKKKTKRFSISYNNFHIPCHLLISMLNGDGFKANETRIQTNGTTSVSKCRPVYCFRRTCGKSILGTKVLRNAVPEHAINFGWPAVQQVRDVCVYFFIFVFPFAPDLLHSQIMRLDMTYRIVN